MDQILDKLYLGSALDASLAESNLITRCLTLCERMPDAVPVPLVHLPLADEVYHDPTEWQWRVELLHLLCQRDTVLVHCRLGISRAPSLVALYLALTHPGMALEEALAHVVSRRPIASPHQETWRGVQDCYALMTQKDTL